MTGEMAFILLICCAGILMCAFVWWFIVEWLASRQAITRFAKLKEEFLHTDHLEEDEFEIPYWAMDTDPEEEEVNDLDN